MRTDTAAFAQKNSALAKDPRYVIELAFDNANTILWYFTSHADAALPGGASSIPGVIEDLAATSQTLNPDTANASIGSITFSLADKAGIVTDTLGAELALGRSTREQRVRVYVGFEGLAWSDYTLVQTQLVTQISFLDGAYKFSCQDVQRQMRENIFTLAKTTLASSVLAGDSAVNVFDTSAFATVAHGSSYTDAPSATVGYVKIQNEVIRYTGKTSTQFTGCARGALNTLAADHAVDTSVAVDQRTAVTEYVYLELPALKAIYALLTGSLTRALSVPGTAGSYASTPDSAAVSVTGDIDVRVKLALNDWTPAANQFIFSKAITVGQWAWDFWIVSTGALVFRTSPDGVTLVQHISTVPAPVLDGSTKVLRATRSAASGTITFYTSDDGVSWTQLGAAVASTPGNIFDGTDALAVGAQPNGGQPAPGKYYYAELRNGIDGPVVASFDAFDASVGAASFASRRTGEVWTVNGTAAIIGIDSLPAAWNLGISPSYVRLADFADPAKKDLWNPADDTQGFIARFEDLEKLDGKKFIETELALLTGTFMPIYADGAIGLKRMTNVLAGAGYVRQLNESNVVSYADLVHDFTSLHNILQVTWNWEPLQKAFTRVNLLVDQDSINVHGAADSPLAPFQFSFRGLHGSRHSSAILAQRFDALRDRYVGPPLRQNLAVLPSLNTFEIGDIVRVRLANTRDFIVGGSLDRSFEIQNISINWITGDLSLQLFGSSEAPGALPATVDASVLSDAWYTAQGTALSSVLTITGSNPGHVSANGSLAGNADATNSGAIYYYDGDLQIDSGITVSIHNNVQLRVKGFLQNNGTINGVGNGIVGATYTGPTPMTSITQLTLGTPGFLGTTISDGGVDRTVIVGGELGILSCPGGTVVGANAAVPAFTLAWDGTTLSGLPADLRGSSGSTGAGHNDNNFLGINPGSVGGNGGAGLIIVCRGLAQGASAKINLSGGDGGAGDADLPFIGPPGGAGGAPGGLLVLLDGASVSATGLTDADFLAFNGKTPIGNPASSPLQETFPFDPTVFNSYYTGTGNGRTFPLPNLSGARGGSRVQYVPGNPAATADPSSSILAAPTNLGLASGTSELLLQPDGTVVPRIKVTWTPSVDARTAGYDLQFKKSADSVFQTAPPILGQPASTAWIIGAQSGVAYDVQIRAAGAAREVSAWLAIAGYVVIGKTQNPSNVTGAFVQQQGGVVVFGCDQVPDADLDRVEIRLLDPGDTNWNNGIAKANILRGQAFTSASIPPGAWTFLFAAYDTSGNRSNAPARVDFTVTSEGFVVIAQRQEAPDWPGTLTNFVRHWTGVLVPQGIYPAAHYAGNEWIDTFVPDPQPTCTYDAPEIDKLIDAPARIWCDNVAALGPGVTSGTANPAQYVDYRLEAGSYDGFEPWLIGLVTFGREKSRLVLTTAVGVAFISGFHTVADKQAVAEEKHGLPIAAGGQAIAFDAVFHLAPSIAVFNDGAGALLPTHTGDSRTGTTLHLWDATPADVGGTGGYRAIGV